MKVWKLSVVSFVELGFAVPFFKNELLGISRFVWKYKVAFVYRSTQPTYYWALNIVIGQILCNCSCQM